MRKTGLYRAALTAVRSTVRQPLSSVCKTFLEGDRIGRGESKGFRTYILGDGPSVIKGHVEGHSVSPTEPFPSDLDPVASGGRTRHRCTRPV